MGLWGLAYFHLFYSSTWAVHQSDTLICLKVEEVISQIRVGLWFRFLSFFKTWCEFCSLICAEGLTEFRNCMRYSCICAWYTWLNGVLHKSSICRWKFVWYREQQKEQQHVPAEVKCKGLNWNSFLNMALQKWCCWVPLSSSVLQAQNSFWTINCSSLPAPTEPLDCVT